MFSLKEINKVALEGFDALPSDASVRLPVMQCLFGCSRATLYRHVKRGLVPQPHRLGERTSVWQVGEVREALQKLHAHATPANP